MRYLILILFFPFLSHAQKCVKITATSGLPIPFATLMNSDNSYGLYSDENGNLCVDLELLSDKVNITSMGFEKRTILKSDFEKYDKFILDEHINELREVVVKPSKNKPTSFGYFYVKKFGTYAYNPNSNVLVCGFIPNKTGKDFLIQEVETAFYPKKSEFVAKYIVRFRFFLNQNGKPNEEVTKAMFVSDVYPNTTNFSFDIESKNVTLPKGGIWIGAEVVGYHNINDKFIPIENGQLGKAIYKNSKKIKKIDLISPSYEMIISKSAAHGFTTDYTGNWRVIKFGGKYEVPKFGVKAID